MNYIDLWKNHIVVQSYDLFSFVSSPFTVGDSQFIKNTLLLFERVSLFYFLYVSYYGSSMFVFNTFLRGIFKSLHKKFGSYLLIYGCGMLRAVPFLVELKSY